MLHFGTFPPGSDGFRHWHAGLHTSYPDLPVDIDALLADGDHVVTHSPFRGTPTGERVLPDGTRLPPTGKALHCTGGAIARTATGQLVDHWPDFDTADGLRQLGLVFPPAQAQQAGA